MTDTEKAKAYDEALERARKIHDEIVNNEVIGFQGQITDIFPELLESEDEKIRKSLVGYFEKFKPQDMWDERFSMEDVLTYLEKIKETEYNKNRDFTIYHPLKNGDGVYECIPYSFYGSLTSFSDAKDLLDFLHTCFSTEQECEEWIENQNGLRLGDFAMNRFVGFFEKKAKEYEINLPRRGYDIYALCVELYMFLRSQSLDTIERMADEINARTVSAQAGLDHKPAPDKIRNTRKLK